MRVRRLILALTSLLAVLACTLTSAPGLAEAQVVFDDAVDSGFHWNVTSVTTPGFVVGTGANRAAMIMVAMSANNATNITASLGGVPGTLVAGSDSGTTASIRTLIFQVINPPSGAQTATVSWTTAMHADVGVITVTGADQMGPVTNGRFTAFNASPAAATSLTIPSSPGDRTASIGFTTNDWVSSNQTIVWGPDSSSVQGDIGAGTGNTTHTWTGPYAGTRSVSGANFRAAASGGPADFTVSASPASQTVAPGGSTSYSLTFNRTGNFSGLIAQSVSGLPSGTTATFTPNPASASSTLSVTTTSSTPPGNYTVTITGQSGDLTRTTAVGLTVGTAPAPSQTLEFDNAVDSGFRWSVTSVTTPAFVVGSGANRAAMIMVAMSANNATNITASLGGVPGSLVAGSDSGTTASIRTLIFQIINPPSGAQTATVSWTTAMHADVGVITVTGADQTTPVTNGRFVAFNVSPAAATSLTIPSSPGDRTASIGFTTNDWVSSNQTIVWGPDSSSVQGDIGAGAGTTTHTWTGPYAGTRSVSGANFRAAASGAAPDFTLSASPSSQSVVAGNSVSYTVSISPTGGFSDPVTLNVSGLPAGATESFTPNPANTSSTLSVATTSSTAAGAYTVTITGVSGSRTRTTTVTLTLTSQVSPDFTLSVSSSVQTVPAGGTANYGIINIARTGGFNDPVTFSVSGLPSGAVATFHPNPASVSSSLSVGTFGGPAASYTLTVTGTGGGITRTLQLTLQVTNADFSLSASPASQTVIAGAGTSYTVTITGMNGWDNSVNLGVTGLPSGATGTFNPNPVSVNAPASTTLSVTTPANTPPGSYTLTIAGNGVGLIHTTTVTLVVNNPVTPDFTVSASPSSQTVAPGEGTTYTVTINRTGGFSLLLSGAVTGEPAGVTTTLPNELNGVAPLIGDTFTVNVRVATNTPPGTYPLTINVFLGGTLSGAQMLRTTIVQLTVTPPAPGASGVNFDNAVTSGFQWSVTSITTPAFVVGTGVNRAAMIMVAMSANNATGITASLGGVPGTLVPGTDTGTTASIRTLIFQVINPPSGTQRATVSWTTAMHADVGVITVSGADQTRPVTNGRAIAFNSAPAAATSVGLLSNDPGDLTASIGFTTNQWISTNQTLTWGSAPSPVLGDRRAGVPAQIDTGTWVATHTWTGQYAGIPHSVSGANFRAAVGP